jgi:hypothetical protein
MAILFHSQLFLQSSAYLKNREKTLANQDIKLDPATPVFNVRFYYYDGRFYYWIAFPKIANWLKQQTRSFHDKIKGKRLASR